MFIPEGLAEDGQGRLEQRLSVGVLPLGVQADRQVGVAGGGVGVFARWLAESKASTRKPGRPRTAENLRELVLRIARETGWGYPRILGN